MWVHDLRDADASCGGKAVGLARLIAAGLPVPEGFVIDGGAFRSLVGDLGSDVGAIGHRSEAAARALAEAQLPPELVAEVEHRAAALGGLLAVRSSATIEDGVAGAAAGVFSSRRAVPVAELWDAIRAVWTSALTPLAAAYARRRGGSIEIGVIVQRYVEGELFTIYTRPPNHPERDEILFQHADGRLETAKRGELTNALAADSYTIERALAAEATGVDVEIIEPYRRSTRDPVHYVVQGRPIVHRTTTALVPAPPTVLAPLEDGRVWTLDIAHNPDPLSTAQQGLVERVERAGVAPYSLRVCAGFLYSSPRESVSAPPFDRATELEQRLERVLDDAHPPGDVEDAIARYLAFTSIWSRELAPLIAAATRGIGHRPSSIEACLAAAARGELDEQHVIDHLGALAPAWDVAVPTFGEQPAILRDAIARAHAVPISAREIDHVSDLAERDDFLFARAQRLVRRALLAHARELGLADPDDIFWLPLDATPSDPDDAHRRARAGRAAAARAASWQMPLVVGAPASPPGLPLHGVGTGPRVIGRVRRFASLASAIAVGAGDVVVTRAVTPALAVLVVGCAALVSETGGLLDHGAALARELGIPCVVGCHGAWSELADGTIVTVDGDQGIVSKT